MGSRLACNGAFCVAQVPMKPTSSSPRDASSCDHRDLLHRLPALTGSRESEREIRTEVCLLNHSFLSPVNGPEIFL
jgi:hypothetical protein